MGPGIGKVTKSIADMLKNNELLKKDIAQAAKEADGDKKVNELAKELEKIGKQQQDLLKKISAALEESQKKKK